MIHTSVILHPSTHYRLQMVSKQEGISMSALVDELLSRGLATLTQAQREKLDTGLKALRGIGDPKITDGSTTIDEVLYGDGKYAAWRGNGAGED